MGMLKCLSCGKEKKLVGHGRCAACYDREIARPRKKAKREAMKAQQDLIEMADTTKPAQTEQPPVAEPQPAIHEASDTQVVIDFSECPEMLATLRQYAKEEYRTVEMQAKYSLRAYFRNLGIWTAESK